MTIALQSSATRASGVSPIATADPGLRPGRGLLCIERIGARSAVTRACAVSPLRLLTPSNHGPAAWVYTSSYGGGLVDGDDVQLDVRVAPGGMAFLSTQASTKVYRCHRGVRSEVHGRVETGGLLVVAPDPVVPFADSIYRQVQRFDVATDGGLVIVDAVTSGRHAFGERWAFRHYEARLDVSVGGRRILYDALALRRSDSEIAARMGRFNVLAAVVIAGGLLASDIAPLLAARSAEPVVRRAPAIVIVSRLREDGCIVRIAGVSVERVARTIRALLAFIPDRFGEDPWTRKW